MTFPTANISLGGGELSPEVRARIDVSKIATGASKLNNMFVRTSGGVTNRAGLEWVMHMRADSPSGTLLRTIDFQFNVAQTYALMFTRRRIRIVKDGVPLFTSVGEVISGITNANPAVVTAVAHGFDHDAEVYIYNDVADITGSMVEVQHKYFRISLILGTAKTISGGTAADPAQITVTGHTLSTGDRVYITGLGGGWTALNNRTFTVTVIDPNTLSLDDEDGTGFGTFSVNGNLQLADPDTFELDVDSTSYGTFSGSGWVVKQVIDVITPYENNDLFDLYYTQSNDVMTITHPDYPIGELKRYSEYDWRYEVIDITPEISAPTGMGGAYTGSGTGIAYKWRVVAVNEDTGDRSVASAAASVASGDLSTAGDKAVITWSAATGATRYDVYRADDNSEFYGFVGSVTGLTFTDRNVDPDFSDTPALAIRDPFNTTGLYPSVVEYFQGRRWYANSDDFPTTVYGSRSGAFKDFNVSQAVTDDDSITVTLSSKQANQIRHLVPLDRMLVLTSGSEWLLKSSSGDLITPSTASFEAQGFWGATKLRPIVAGSVALFVTGSEENDPNSPNYTMVRDIQYTFQSDNYRGNELTVLAQHLFEGYELVDWAYAQFPYSIVWCVRNDGKAVAMTYVAEQEIFAWSVHETDGLFESVCTVRETGEDVPYFVVNRKINGTWQRGLERMHTHQFDNVKDWFGVDAGITHDSPFTIVGVTQTNPVVVQFAINVDGLYFDGDVIEIDDVVGMTELNGNKYKINNVSTVYAELQTFADVPVDIDGTGYTAYDEGGVSRKCKQVIDGLDHIEGKTVVALADGNVIDGLTVTNGEVDLGNYYARVHCGLPYTADFQTIDANVSDPSGVVFDDVRKVDGVTLRFYKTRGGSVGSDANKLYDLKWREYEDWGDAGALTNGDVYTPVHSRWDRLATVFYRQDKPLPVTILSVIPEVSRAGD